MDELENTFEQMGLGNNYDLVLYVRTLAIPEDVKTQLIYLIENDSYSSYMDIYNICLENDIELPPI
jgi:hypothetical protein